MTALVVFLIGVGLLCGNSTLWYLGAILILCSISIGDKDTTIAKLRKRLSELGVSEMSEAANSDS